MDIVISVLTKDVAEKNANKIIGLGLDNSWENWTKENLLLDLNNKWNYSLIATYKDEICAYVIASDKSPYLHIHHIIVGHKYRGNKIGNKLIEYLTKLGKNRFTDISLKVHKTNARAIKFYGSEGFSLLKNEPEYLVLVKPV